MLKENIQKLAALPALATPCYFYDMQLLDATLSTVRRLSDSYGFRVHYAMKANFETRILKHIAGYGFGADCVSGGEVSLALECGFEPSRIVFAGVGKTDEEIVCGLENNIFCFNCESLAELEIINGLAAERGMCARVALRINPDVDPQTHKHISTGHADSKFGISYKEIDKAISSLHELSNIQIVGLHFHIGSQIRNMDVFRTFCSRANTIVAWFEEKGIVLDHINVGGGLGIDYADPLAEPIPDFEEYFRIFAEGIVLKKNQTLHFELGRSIIGQSGLLVSRVLLTKHTASGKNFIIVDAAMTELMRPALYQAHHKIENISSDKPGQTYSVAGGVCESTDVFDRDIELPETERGDLLLFYSAGAYGSSMASHYNLRALKPSVFSSDL